MDNCVRFVIVSVYPNVIGLSNREIVREDVTVELGDEIVPIIVWAE